MASLTTDRLLGEYGARLDSIEHHMREMEADIKQIRAFSDNVRGGWKALVILSSIIGALVSWVISAVRKAA